MSDYKRLSDTAAIANKPLNPVRLQVASDDFYAAQSADGAVSGPQPGRFRRETGAGNSSLAEACKLAGCEE